MMAWGWWTASTSEELASPMVATCPPSCWGTVLSELPSSFALLLFSSCKSLLLSPGSDGDSLCSSSSLALFLKPGGMEEANTIACLAFSGSTFPPSLTSLHPSLHLPPSLSSPLSIGLHLSPSLPPSDLYLVQGICLCDACLFWEEPLRADDDRATTLSLALFPAVEALSALRMAGRSLLLPAATGRTTTPPPEALNRVGGRAVATSLACLLFSKGGPCSSDMLTAKGLSSSRARRVAHKLDL